MYNGYNTVIVYNTQGILLSSFNNERTMYSYVNVMLIHLSSLSCIPVCCTEHYVDQITNVTNTLSYIIIIIIIIIIISELIIIYPTTLLLISWWYILLLCRHH